MAICDSREQPHFIAVRTVLGERLKSYRRDRVPPRCYLSHVPEQRDWVVDLARDLREAGVVVLDTITGIRDSDTVIVVNTPGYERAWSRADPAIGVALPEIRRRLGRGGTSGGNVLQILRQDNEVLE